MEHLRLFFYVHVLFAFARVMLQLHQNVTPSYNYDWGLQLHQNVKHSEIFAFSFKCDYKSIERTTNDV